MDDSDDDNERMYKSEVEISTVYQDLESLTHYQSLHIAVWRYLHACYTRVYSDILLLDGPLNYFVRSVTPYEGVKKCSATMKGDRIPADSFTSPSVIQGEHRSKRILHGSWKWSPSSSFSLPTALICTDQYNVTIIIIILK